MKTPPALVVINHRKLKVDDMYPEVSGNQNYDDHYANYSEDVHGVVLPLRDNGARRASTLYVYA